MGEGEAEPEAETQKAVGSMERRTDKRKDRKNGKEVPNPF